MIQFIFLMIIMGFVVALWYCLESSNFGVAIGLMMFVFGGLWAVVYLISSDKVNAHMRIKYQQPIIDLPKEHQLISHNKLKPDTLLGYYRNDTLVIEFKH